MVVSSKQKVSSNSLRVLYAASECAPLVKTGGLADVAGVLPPALRQLGIDARLILPGYRAVLTGLPRAREVARIDPIARFPAARLLEATLPQGVPAYIVDCAPLYDRDGGPYQDGSGADWPDNPLRFGLLSRTAAILASRQSPLDWRADIVHANDWQTGLAPAYVAFSDDRATPTVITIHNLAFQGIFEPQWLSDLALPAASFVIEGLEYHGRVSFLKAGLFYANTITTVSPGYAKEIQHEPLGMGMQGLLAARQDRLSGILNGIDTATWDPANDSLIPARYDATTLHRKATNKLALQRRFRLVPRADVPVLGIVSRLTAQKGIDLLFDIVDEVLAMPAQIVIVASGDKSLEQRLRALHDEHAGWLASFVGFDERLAHLVEAGSDAFVMPSRFEPCGMNQMYSQRYGTPPIVHATGGLNDSVVDCAPQTLADGTATGFKFLAPTAEALMGAIQRCAAVYRDTPNWRSLQRNGMAKDFSWHRAAQDYATIYARLVPS